MFLVLALALTLSTPSLQPIAVSPFEDPIAISPEIEAFLDATIDRTQEPLQQLEQLVSVVFQDNLLGFSYSSETKSAIRTFEERSGNCLSFTHLLIGMSRYLGLDARYREVEIAPAWSMQGNIVVLSKHVNVLVRIGVSSYIVDLFPEVFRIQLEGYVVSDERGLSHFFNNLGARHLAEGRPRRAVAFYREALRHDPTAGFAWTNMGAAYSQMGNRGKAIECYRRALDLNADDLVTIANLALAYRKDGDYRKAASLEKKVKKFREKNPFYHFALGQDAYRVGDYQDAILHFRDALKRDSHEHHILFALAKALLSLERYEEAEEVLREARRNAPGEADRLRYARKLELLAAALP